MALLQMQAQPEPGKARTGWQHIVLVTVVSKSWIVDDQPVQ